MNGREVTHREFLDTGCLRARRIHVFSRKREQEAENTSSQIDVFQKIYVPDDKEGTSRARGQLTKMPVKTKEGEKFSFFKSYYVDDAAFLLLNREDAIRATKLIVSHFKRFGLTVHTGSRSLGEGSKTEALYLGTSRHLGRNRTPRRSYWQQLQTILSIMTDTYRTPMNSNTSAACLRSN